MRVVGRQRRDLRREHGGERMQVFRPIHAQHGLDAGQRGGLRGNAGGVGAQHDDADFCVGNRLGAGDALGGGGIQGLSVVFADDEYLVH